MATEVSEHIQYCCSDFSISISRRPEHVDCTGTVLATEQRQVSLVGGTMATGRAPNTPAREQVRAKTTPYSGYGHAYAICRTGQGLTGAAGSLLRRHNQTDVTATTPPTGDGPSAGGSNDPGATFLWWGSCVLSEWGGREYRVDLRLSVFPAILTICTRAKRKPVTRIAAFSAKHRQRTMSNRLQCTFIQKLANENISKLF